MPLDPVIKLRNGVEFRYWPDRVVTKFPDGSECPGMAHWTPEYTRFATRLGFTTQYQYLAHHELAHSFVASRRGEFSYVLHSLAQGREPDPWHANFEEQQVFCFQAYCRLNEWSPGLNTLKTDFTEAAVEFNKLFDGVMRHG